VKHSTVASHPLVATFLRQIVILPDFTIRRLELMLSPLALANFLAFTSSIMMLLVWRRFGRRHIVVTPYLLACCFLLLFGWTGQISAILSGLTENIYPSFVLFSGTTTFVAGFWLFKDSQALPVQLFLKPLVCDKRTSYFHGCLLLLIIALAISTYRYQGLPPVTHVIRELATGRADIDELARYSKDARMSLSSGHWTYDTPQRGNGIAGRFLRIAFPYLLCITLGVYYSTRSRLWLYYSTIVGALAIFYVGGDATRAPLATASIIVVVFLSFVKPIGARHLVVTSAVIFAFLVISTMTSSKGLRQYYESGSVSHIAEAIVTRLGANGVDDVAVIELIQDNQLDYHYGLLFLEQLLAPIPGVRLQEVPFDLRLYYLIDPYSTDHVFATTTLLGVVYLDGGILGVMVAYCLLGVLTAKFNRYLASGPKEIASMAMKASLICAMGRVMLAGVLYVLVDALLIILVHQAFCRLSRRREGLNHDMGTRGIVPRRQNSQVLIGAGPVHG
jgi:hypothetical protein